MLLTGQCTLLNTEKKQGIKDPSKVYFNVLLMQDSQTVNCMTDEKLYNGVLSQIPQFTPVNCEFDFNPVFKSMRLTHAKAVK